MATNCPRESSVTDPNEMIVIAVTPNEEQAERWADALRKSGIEVEVHIGDARTLTPSTSLDAAGGPVETLFAYPLYVPAASGEQAMRILIKLGWDKSPGERVVDSGASIPLSLMLAALMAGAMAIFFIALRLISDA